MSENPPADSTYGLAEKYLRAMRHAADLLGSSVDFDATLGNVIIACLPAVGDFGWLDLRIDGDTVRTARAWENQDAQAALDAGPWISRDGGPHSSALHTGEPSLHPDMDLLLDRAHQDDADAARLRALGVVSMITVPMRYREESLGALTLFMAQSRRRHTQDDLQFAGEMAALAAPVVANARLLERHRRAEAALRASEERLRLAIAAGKLGIWDWDVPGDRVTWSDRVYELHGVQPGTFGGRVADFSSLVHPDDREAVRSRVEAALWDDAEFETEFRVPHADGTIRWLATRAEVQRDAAGRPLRMVGATYDVTERARLLAAERAARAEMASARQRLELLASAGTMLSRSLDPQATLEAIATIVVPGVADWCRVDLLDGDGVLQRALTYHADPATRERGIELVNRLRASPEQVGSMAWAAATGLSHLANFAPASEFDSIRDRDLLTFAQAIGMRAYFVVPLVARGRTLGAMAALQAESGRPLGQDDCSLIAAIAQRAALALDNARLYVEAADARRNAESASRAKDEFLAILGHELRNPLAPIVTALRLMDLRGETATAPERGVIARQVAHLTRLVDDLLDVSRITRGKIELKRRNIDAADLVATAVELVRPMLEQREVRFELTLPPDPAYVSGDAVRLAQILSNLLSNAAKFTPKGGRVALTTVVRDDAVEFVVEDDGIGIPPDLLPRVFDLFVQGEQPIDRRDGGLGLGLAIVQKLVALHDGSVTAASDGAGKGSTFRVVLSKASGGAEAVTAADPPARWQVSGRVLIVDDNADAAETTAALLRFEGLEARIAGDGVSALAEQEQWRPAVAILDIGLPVMDGYELARRMRQAQGADPLRLIALTGYGSPSDRARAAAAGFDEHLVKPVGHDELLRVIERLLGDAGEAAGASLRVR